MSLALFKLFLFLFFINKINSFYCRWHKENGSMPVNETIKVVGIRNFYYKRIFATKNLRSECNIQATKNAKNIIEIEDGGTIKNVIIDDGAKGVWCKGNCNLINVFFKKICYHAVDFGNSLDSKNKIFNVIGGAAMNAPDKIFTQSGAGKTFIKNFCAENFGKCWRSCGMECYQYKRSISIINSKFQGPFLSLICFLFFNNYILIFIYF